MQVEYDENSRTLKYPEAKSVSDTERIFWDIINQAKIREPGKYVWFMVGPGKRKEYLQVFRKFMKYHRIPTSIENIIKVVQEETI